MMWGYLNLVDRGLNLVYVLVDLDFVSLRQIRFEFLDFLWGSHGFESQGWNPQWTEWLIP